MKVKICGLKRREDVIYVNKYHPDYIGFVFAGTKRKISIDQAAALRQMLDPSIQAVGVFVNEAIENIHYLVTHQVIDCVQLHGEETEEIIQGIQSFGVPVIKAIRLGTQRYEKPRFSSADYLLFDSYDQDAYGGTGKRLNKRILQSLCGNYFVAGGINIDNVDDILSYCNPYAIDLSSGVETNGFKDEEKIRMFIEHIRRREVKI